MTLGRYVLTADVTVPAGVALLPRRRAGHGEPGHGHRRHARRGLTVIASQTLGHRDVPAVLDRHPADRRGGRGREQLRPVRRPPGRPAGHLGERGHGRLLPAGRGARLHRDRRARRSAVKNIGAGTTGSVYNGSLTVTPLTGGDNKGAFAWTGAGSPAGWSPGPFPVTFLAGTPLWLDSAGPLYSTIGAGNLRAWIDGQDNVGHNQWGLSN